MTDPLRPGFSSGNAPEAPRPLRVLVVEDSDDDAILLMRELRRAGFEPQTARAASADALRRALHEQWDVVIADYRLPGFSGLEALRIVRETTTETPFFLVSGSIGEELAVEAMQAGANDYVMKGNLSRLIPAIDRELREVGIRQERSMARVALEQSEQRFAGVLDAAPTAMLVIDRTGRIVLVNEHASRSFGAPRSALVGRPVRELIPGDIQTASAENGDSGNGNANGNGSHEASSDGAALPSERVGIRADGTTFPADIGVSSFVTEGEPFVIVAIHDITGRRSLESQLRQSQKMEAIGRLAGGVAHDFNNLLTAMNGYADLVLSELPADSPIRSDVEEIRKAGERASALTGQLLAFGRRQSGTAVVVDPDAVLADFEAMLRRLVGEHIEFATAFEATGSRVKVDPGQLQQVVLNLVVNARDAMPDGGRLTLATTALTVTPRTSIANDGVAAGKWVRISVSDTGHGMTPEVQAHVFEPFFTTKSEGQGTGLGLATVYGIVNSFGGRTAFSSAPGSGTTFRIYLRTTGDGIAVESPSKRSVEAGGTERILLVEDEPTVRALVRQVLASRGYQVVEARDPVDAIDLAEREPFDLLLTDVVMPDIGGPELAQRIAARRPEMPVLFMSGYTETPIGRLGLRDGDAHFLQKPFTPDVLAQRVRAVLDEPAAGATDRVEQGLALD